MLTGIINYTPGLLLLFPALIAPTKSRHKFTGVSFMLQSKKKKRQSFLSLFFFFAVECTLHCCSVSCQVIISALKSMPHISFCVEGGILKVQFSLGCGDYVCPTKKVAEKVNAARWTFKSKTKKERRSFKGVPYIRLQIYNGLAHGSLWQDE